jgi:acyl-CoA synthetase (NDP forming)
MQIVLSKEMKKIFAASREAGWMLEPKAKELLSLAGLNVPRFTWANGLEEATQFAHTAVEIYKDTSVRMAPLVPKDVDSMLQGLRAHQLLEGYRGSAPANVQALTDMLIAFSGFVMDCEDLIESIDLNPVKCSSEGCIIADARIVLTTKNISHP